MTTHPTPTPAEKSRPSAPSLPAGNPTPTWLGRWLFQPSPGHAKTALLHEEVAGLVQARTAELEREIARLRQEIDRRTALDRQAATASLEASASARTRFLAAITHELRTPLNGIIGVAELLTKTALTPQQTHLVETLRQSSDSLLRSANDLLEFARIESGRLTIERVDFDLAEELQVALDLHAELAARKGLELIIDLDPALPPRLRGDPVRIRQVVLNLINNAIKFTERGEVAFRAQLERSGTHRSRVHFSVTDTGIGISAATQERLFEPFVQADADTARRFGGTGLGLAICKHLVTLMGGQIGVTSTPSTGSTFWFTIEFDHPAPAPESAAPSTLTGRHILIVDDNATNRKLFCQLAASWKMQAAMADSGPSALAYLRAAAQAQTPVDLVLIDHHMTGTDGFALAREITAEKQIPAPILTMLTSHIDRLTRAEMEAHGIKAYEAKPLHPRKLRHMLLNALQ